MNTQYDAEIERLTEEVKGWKERSELALDRLRGLYANTGIAIDTIQCNAPSQSATDPVALQAQFEEWAFTRGDRNFTRLGGGYLLPEIQRAWLAFRAGARHARLSRST